MPPRRRLAKRRISVLDFPEWLDLCIGQKSDRGGVFGTDADRREAWEIHRDAIMAEWDRPGSRPRAWWDYEIPAPRHPVEPETLALVRLGMLEPDERAELERATWPMYEKLARDVAAGDAERYPEKLAYYGVPEDFSPQRVEQVGGAPGGRQRAHGPYWGPNWSKLEVGRWMPHGCLHFWNYLSRTLRPGT